MAAANRQSEMSINLGDDQVKLERVDAMEWMSQPFLITVDVVAPLELELHSRMGQACSLTVREDDEIQRYFHGLMVGGEYIGEEQRWHRYRLTLRPWSYFLAQNRGMAIFQEKTVVDIIKEVAASLPGAEIEYRLGATYYPRDYCVQYRESDFAFICRLMEEEGIYYYFRHEKNRHVMVLCDGPNAHSPGRVDKLQYLPSTVSVFASDSTHRRSTRNYVQSLVERVSTTGIDSVVLHDWNFRKPQSPQTVTAGEENIHVHDTQEVFDYPGNFSTDIGETANDDKIGALRSKVRMEGSRTHRQVFTGTSQNAGVWTGQQIDIYGHPNERMNTRYLVIGTYHSIAGETFHSGKKQGELVFNTRFEAIGGKVKYRPAPVTPRPVIAGLESAVVTGPAGEEIYTDSFGRVKVRFHWDRSGTEPEKSSCWIRVSQTGGLGNIILPRVGHEVLVDFLGGDPDRPLVVGRVFNSGAMPVYKLPDHKTVALWRTLRYKQAGSYDGAMSLDLAPIGGNELFLEDKGGSEEVRLYAERDMNMRVRHVFTQQVGLDETWEVGRDRTRTVHRDETVLVERDRTAQVKNNETTRVDMKQVHKVGTDQEYEVGQKQTRKVGTDRSTTVGMSDKHQVGTEYELAAGTKITLKVGASSIVIDNTGIKISGMQVEVSGTATLKTTGMQATYQGGVMASLTAPIVKIN